MYLKSFKLNNFRKYRTEENIVYFAGDKKLELSEEKEIDVSTATTLIIGKNNVGKTSIVTALKKLQGKLDKFVATDFNFSYLNKLLKTYSEIFKQAKDRSEVENKAFPFPEMSFTMEIELNDQDDIVSVIAPLLLLENTTSATLHIKVQLKEQEEFKTRVEEIVKSDSENKLKDLLDLMNNINFNEYYYDKNDKEIMKFKLQDLLEVKSIEANTLTQKDSLSKAFNKIIAYRYKSDQEENGKDAAEINKEITRINERLTERFKNNHATEVNTSLSKITTPEKLSISLTSDLTHENLLSSNILVYEYMEKGLTIPENQYGLGYTNLVMIIAEIMEYIEKSPGDAFTSKLNFISIEEPETYMHPQMQELFIKNINAAIEQLLSTKRKDINSQIIITTHSSHILNSKIHSGNTFDYINYCTSLRGENLIVNLEDSKIIDKEVVIFKDNKTTSSDKETPRYDNLAFIKKHIKYVVSELFFSDAAIFVEGVTEETLIKYWLDQDEKLQKFYITVFNINGAYGHIYRNLIKKLKVPVLIITDLDIKRNPTKEEKDTEDTKENEKLEPIKCIKDRETTNQTLIHFFDKKISNIINENIVEDNLYVTYQNKIDDFYATSFEEALILTNYKNEILHNALSKTKPNLYKKYCGNDELELKNFARTFQEKLNRDKSEFTNRLLLESIMEEDKTKQLKKPEYIKNGLCWLVDQLEGE